MSFARKAALYLAAINIAAFAAFWFDKRAAVRGDRRIPERTLLTLTALGGWAGALAGQSLLRHKTRKEPFRTLLWSIVVVEAVLLVGWTLFLR